MVIYCLTVLPWLVWPYESWAEVYQSPDSFVAETLGNPPPAPEVLWLNGELQGRIVQVLGHPYKSLRVKYWRDGPRTVWVLDEIGKDEDITIGFAIDGATIERTAVLEFRESRGWEIKFPSFTRQFAGARLDDHNVLDREIDGITGATLSVDAYRRLAHLALVLHRAVTAHAP